MCLFRRVVVYGVSVLTLTRMTHGKAKGASQPKRKRQAQLATGPRRDGGTALGGSAINLLRVDLFFTHVNVRCVNPPYRHPPPPT